ncbi:MAG: tetratricopeptide repeat protein [Anaerolineaceae bacterium]|nr:tetratricopeptide repeat protein [Anaerolineaceae bacterium]
MHLRTPKRYRRGNKRSPISLRWLWLWILTPIVVYFGIQIYNNLDTIAPPIQQALYNMADSAQSQMATAQAPPPTPTEDPSDAISNADANWSQGRIEAALSDYKRVLDAVPNDVQTYYRYTLGLTMEGRLTDAQAAAEQLVTANPFSSDAWALRAMVLDWSGKPGEAIASALHALELDQNSARAKAFLAEAYYDMGDSEQALDTVNQALELDPQSFEALRVRGLLSWNTDYLETRQYFSEAYDIAPNMPYLAIDLAQINFALQEYDEAIDILRGVVEVNPQNTTALYWLGSYYNAGVGNYAQAAEYLNRCVEADANNINCYYLLGRVQINLEQYAAAAQSLKSAVDQGSSDPRHYLWAGRAQIFNGSCPAAIPYLQKGYDLVTEDTSVEVVQALESDLRDCRAPIAQPEATDEAATG